MQPVSEVFSNATWGNLTEMDIFATCVPRLPQRKLRKPHFRIFGRQSRHNRLRVIYVTANKSSPSKFYLEASYPWSGKEPYYPRRIPYARTCFKEENMWEISGISRDDGDPRRHPGWRTC
jgi:hypothetical protein